jgi:hypothetical protein
MYSILRQSETYSEQQQARNYLDPLWLSTAASTQIKGFTGVESLTQASIRMRRFGFGSLTGRT